MLNDNVKARKINDKGDYEKVIRGVDLIDSQNYFMHDDFSVIEEEEEYIEESLYSKLRHLFQINVIEKINNRDGK
jgi:polyphosphate kinase